MQEMLHHILLLRLPHHKFFQFLIRQIISHLFNTPLRFIHVRLQMLLYDLRLLFAI